MGQCIVGNAQRLAESSREATQLGTGAGHAHLLTEHGSNRQLRAVDMTRGAAAGVLHDERREQRIDAQCFSNGHRVGIKIEESPAPLHRGGQVSGVGELKVAINVIGQWSEGHEAVAVR